MPEMSGLKMKNVFVFYGEEKHLSRKGLMAVVENYRKDAGDLNLTVIDGTVSDVGEIISQAKALPFLAPKRFILLENFFGRQKEAEQKRLLEFLEALPESTLLAVWEEGKLRSKSFSKLLSLERSQAKEYLKLDSPGLTKWVQEEALLFGGKISPRVAGLLIGEVGENLAQLENELQKLTSYDPEISAENVAKLVVGNRFANVFEMVDAFGARNPHKAMLEIQRLVENGESEMYILSMIVRQFRNIAMVKDSKSKGQSEKEIAETLGLHPFVVKKTLSQASAFSISDIRKAYASCVNAEYKIKTGENPRLVLGLMASKVRG